MTPGALFDRAAARSLRLLQAGVRKVPKDRRTAITRRLKPAFDRRMDRLDRTDLRSEERSLRRSIAAEPDNGELWYELGLCRAARGRPRAAVQAFVRSADEPRRLTKVTLTLLNQHRLRHASASRRVLDQMSRLAEDQPDSIETQLLFGAFLLDQGHLERGRSQVQQGYDLLLERERPNDRVVPRAHQGPDFMILGPAKTGTSSLYAFLAEHPDIIPSPRKELHFWRHHYGRSVEHFDAYFPTRLPPGVITGEASVNTLTTPNVASDIAARYPDLNAIVLHRDPVARAFSDYQMRRRMRFESRSFESAIEFEIRRIGPTPPVDTVDIPADGSYLLRSCILPYLKTWVDALGADQVMVVESAGLSKRRQDTLDAVHEFLGVPARRLDGLNDQNVHEYDPLAPDIADRLRAWFEPHEAALATYLADHPDIQVAP